VKEPYELGKRPKDYPYERLHHRTNGYMKMTLKNGKISLDNIILIGEIFLILN